MFINRRLITRQRFYIDVCDVCVFIDIQMIYWVDMFFRKIFSKTLFPNALIIQTNFECSTCITGFLVSFLTIVKRRVSKVNVPVVYCLCLGRRKQRVSRSYRIRQPPKTLFKHGSRRHGIFPSAVDTRIRTEHVKST